LRTDENKLRSAMAWQSRQERSSQRQVQHAGLIHKHGITFQGVVSIVLECAEHVIRLAVAVAT
jgi:hypothetical protein